MMNDAFDGINSVVRVLMFTVGVASVRTTGGKYARNTESSVL